MDSARSNRAGFFFARAIFARAIFARAIFARAIFPRIFSFAAFHARIPLRRLAARPSPREFALSPTLGKSSVCDPARGRPP